MANARKIPVVQVSSKSGKEFLWLVHDSQKKRGEEVTIKVKEILDNILENGDSALFEYTKNFDKVDLNARSVKVTAKEIQTQAKKAAPALQEAIREAAIRIENYHRKQMRTGFTLKTAEGTLSQIVRPINRVALYIPGGKTIYPSSVLMDAIPAKIAGVKEIVAVTPPRGELDPGIAFALELLEIKEVYKIGGAQAIGALAYGTKTIAAVDKIVGPGNPFVATAKRLVYGTVDIDSIAGPSDVVVLADDSVDPSWVALDLLAQAEHGTGDEIAICITDDKDFAKRVAEATAAEIENSTSRDVFMALPEYAISVLVCKSREESIATSNRIAPEHLQIMTKEYKKDLEGITNAAAIFLGKYSPVALGDYFIGTNHVLPTGGSARFASPLGVDSFLKRMSVAEVTLKGLDSATPFVSTIARAEKFVHHALSVERR
jgi:histidinol dehydrogenase